MNILVVHNSYQQRGGEDQVFAAESRLLEDHGHTVVRYNATNHDLVGLGKRALAAVTLWNQKAYREIRAIVYRECPTVVHVHNTFPLISPAAYYAARSNGAAVVQTLHNYRLLCPSATVYREGSICEKCVGKTVPYPAVRHACYRSNTTASLGVSAMLAVHRLAGTWTRQVDMYISLTNFAKGKFIEGGLPEARIAVKPNFVFSDPGHGSQRCRFALFAGRLAPEKGIRTLLAAWRIIGTGTPLELYGDGPMASRVRQCAVAGVEWHGWTTREHLLNRMRVASFLILPSTWYESFPMIIAEAYAAGLPVITSRLGSMAELIEDGKTGLHFRPGDPEDLATKVRWASEHPEHMAAMGRNARNVYERLYGADRNYELLMSIYDQAITRRHESRRRRRAF